MIAAGSYKPVAKASLRATAAEQPLAATGAGSVARDSGSAQTMPSAASESESAACVAARAGSVEVATAALKLM